MPQDGSTAHSAHQPDEVARALDSLLAEGSRAEREHPKLRRDGHHVDYQVLTIAGRLALVVARQSRHPIANLHLGGLGDEVAAVRQRIDADVWSRMETTCAQLAQASDCHQLGFDVLFEPNGRSCRMVEANAFGHLLPGLRREGRDVYETQVAQLEARDDATRLGKGAAASCPPRTRIELAAMPSRTAPESERIGPH